MSPAHAIPTHAAAVPHAAAKTEAVAQQDRQGVESPPLLGREGRVKGLHSAGDALEVSAPLSFAGLHHLRHLVEPLRRGQLRHLARTPVHVALIGALRLRLRPHRRGEGLEGGVLVRTDLQDIVQGLETPRIVGVHPIAPAVGMNPGAGLAGGRRRALGAGQGRKRHRRGESEDAEWLCDHLDLQRYDIVNALCLAHFACRFRHGKGDPRQDAALRPGRRKRP
jgi:hypothetical protein